MTTFRLFDQNKYTLCTNMECKHLNKGKYMYYYLKRQLKIDVEIMNMSLSNSIAKCIFIPLSLMKNILSDIS